MEWVYFLGSSPRNVPISFQLFANYIHGVPETNVFLTLETVSIPTVPDEYKIEVQKCGSGIYRVIGRYGYSEQPIKITDVLERAFQNGLAKADYTFYFYSEHIRIKQRNIIIRFILSLYALMKRFFIGSVSHYKLPKSGVMSVGVQVIL